MPTKQITPEQLQKFLGGYGLNCPNCGSADVRDLSAEEECNDARRQCRDCHARWALCYKLVGIDYGEVDFPDENGEYPLE